METQIASTFIYQYQTFKIAWYYASKNQRKNTFGHRVTKSVITPQLVFDLALPVEQGKLGHQHWQHINRKVFHTSKFSVYYDLSKALHSFFLTQFLRNSNNIIFAEEAFPCDLEDPETLLAHTSLKWTKCPIFITPLTNSSLTSSEDGFIGFLILDNNLKNLQKGIKFISATIALGRKVLL